MSGIPETPLARRNKRFEVRSRSGVRSCPGALAPPARPSIRCIDLIGYGHAITTVMGGAGRRFLLGCLVSDAWGRDDGGCLVCSRGMTPSARCPGPSGAVHCAWGLAWWEWEEIQRMTSPGSRALGGSASARGDGPARRGAAACRSTPGTPFRCSRHGRRVSLALPPPPPPTRAGPSPAKKSSRRAGTQPSPRARQSHRPGRHSPARGRAWPGWSGGGGPDIRAKR